jgi:mannose-6-phosphate isomerase-like protein (cupin superfamily)
MHQKITTENGVQPPETVFERPDMQVKYAVLRPGEEVPWHLHSNVRDTFYVISGRMVLRVADPEETMELSPGDIYTVRVGRPHWVGNAGDTDMEWILLQGMGVVDLKPLPAKS